MSTKLKKHPIAWALALASMGLYPLAASAEVVEKDQSTIREEAQQPADDLRQDATRAEERMEGGLATDEVPAIEKAAVGFRRSAFYIAPQIGAEFASLGAKLYEAVPTNVDTLVGGLALGVVAGFRMGVVNIGARYQGTISADADINDLAFHKVYGELGLNFGGGIVNGNAFLDFGYAGLDSTQTYLNGLGGKVGAQVDIFPTPWLSVGPMVSFDLHGYDQPGSAGWESAAGGTVMAMVGFHI